MQLVTIFGAGLLVGTSLVVIIPEGVETMYGHHNHHHGKSLSEKGSFLLIEKLHYSV